MAMKKRTKGNITAPSLPGKDMLAEVNNNEAGNIYNSLFAKNRKVEYDNKDIALVNIRTNPDNQIFRAMDDDEDIRILAEDIKRNGLMHNLVVFPEQEEGSTVYVLLSGERRFRALNYLQEKGDATWNIVNCNVVTTPLTENEKKVLLYSANLQVRGGFSDEAIRRQAIAEFITCLQRKPYNMSREEALNATKSVSTVNPRTIERDARIEEKLKGKLKTLLNDKFLTRSECETYLRFEADKQDEIANRFEKLQAVDCHSDDAESAGKNYVEVLRDTLHDAFRELLYDAQRQGTTKEYEAAYEKAIGYFDDGLADLSAKADEYGRVKASSKPEEISAINYEGKKEAAKDRVRKEHEVTETKSSVIQKNVPQMVKKLNKTYSSKAFVKALKGVSKESRDADVAALNEIIEISTKLKNIIEAIE